MKKKWFGMVSVLMVLAVLFTGLPAIAQAEAEETTEIGTACPALSIRAPRVAPVGREVTIGVFEQGSGEPVEGAFVFALSRDNAEAFKAEMATLSEDNTVTAADKDYKALADVYGELIGITGNNGEVYHAFDEAGWYLLVAVKPGCLPGFAPIRIGTPPKILGIRAPRIARTGDEVTIGVFERKTQSPVEGAGVWVVSREQIGVLKAEIAKLKEGVRTAENDVDFEPLVSLYGEFIDWTDENGEVRHTFEEPGLYFLVAVKKGCYPGFAPIQIRSLSVDSSGNALQTNALTSAQVQQTSVITNQVQLNNKPEIAETE